MQRLVAIAAITAVTLFAPQIVLAQASYSGDQAHSSVPDQIRSGFEQSGFTNIQGVPDAILVRAIDPDGNPVTMVVDTDTFKDTSTGDGRSNGQATGRSAKMTDDSEKATSPSESNQGISQSEKITSGPREAEPLTLTNTQRQAIWQQLGSQSPQTDVASQNLNIGQAVPNGLSLRALPDDVSNRVPMVKAYDYAMFNNQLLIVDPSTKKIVAIVAD
jgi:hypothetical protein